MGIAVEDFCIKDYLGQRLHHAWATLIFCHAMQTQSSTEECAQLHGGVQRGPRALQDHRYVTATNKAPLPW